NRAVGIARRVFLAFGTVLTIVAPANAAARLEVHRLPVADGDAGVGPGLARRDRHFALAETARALRLGGVVPERRRAILIELDGPHLDLLDANHPPAIASVFFELEHTVAKADEPP